MTRMFLEGRTENVMSVTEDCANFVHAMCNKTASVSSKFKLRHISIVIISCDDNVEKLLLSK